MSEPQCRRARKEMGLSYPRSSCVKCGSLMRPGWRCAEDIEGRPAGVSGAMAVSVSEEPTAEDRKLARSSEEVAIAIWEIIKPLESDPEALQIIAIALGSVVGSCATMATDPKAFVEAVADVAKSVEL
jgi:hypothetical protein